MKDIFGPLLLLLLLFSDALFAQEKTSISGTVRDTSGESLIGVSIIIEGTSIGTVTDIDGKFELKIPDTTDHVLVSYVGYQTQRISIGNTRIFNIVMEAETQLLDELVVVGYAKESQFDRSRFFC